MALELNKSDLTAEHGRFLADTNILEDIAQEAQNAGLEKMSEDELVERVENILLEKIKRGDNAAYFQLGLFYFEQEIYGKARVYFERSKDFNFQSLYQLGVMLYDGIGTDADTKLGVEYMQRVASSSAPEAKHLKHSAEFNIGRAHFQGYGVQRQSDSEAVRWWLLAADDGNPKASVKAQTTLGMYFSRWECRDIKKTFFWHSEACGNGSIESQGALGVMYENGIGVKFNPDNAYICLKEAADRGNVYAMGNLIAHYYRRKLFTKAADLASKVSVLEDVVKIAEQTDCVAAYICKGLSLANFYNARCLDEGLGTKKNKEQAHHFYSRSYKFDADVCAHLQNITQQGVI